MPNIIVPTVNQLRAHCPLLGGRVAAAANFRLGLERYNANMPPPAAYVVPIGAESEGPGSMTGVWQQVTRTVGIVVEFLATPDRRGQQPAMDTEAMEDCLNAAILGWEPETCLTVNRQGYWLAGWEFLDLDRARMFAQWRYSLNSILQEGFVEPCEDPLGIEVNYWAPRQDFPYAPEGGPPPPIITEIDLAAGTAPAKPGWPPGPFVTPAKEEN